MPASRKTTNKTANKSATKAPARSSDAQRRARQEALAAMDDAALRALVTPLWEVPKGKYWLPYLDRLLDAIAPAAAERGIFLNDMILRVLPELGLDAQGQMPFELGGCHYRLGVDARLAPMLHLLVDGRPTAEPLRKLPQDKASRSTTPENMAAKKRFNTFDAACYHVAGVLLAHMESAMIEGWRWRQEDFEAVFLQQRVALLTAQRLLWGIFERTQEGVEGEGAGQGGDAVGQLRQRAEKLLAVVRPDADGQLRTLDGQAWSWPQGQIDLPDQWLSGEARIGILHPLEVATALDAATRQTQLEAIAALNPPAAGDLPLQPFEQLTRWSWTAAGTDLAAERQAAVQAVMGQRIAPPAFVRLGRSSYVGFWALVLQEQDAGPLAIGIKRFMTGTAATGSNTGVDGRLGPQPRHPLELHLDIEPGFIHYYSNTQEPQTLRAVRLEASAEADTPPAPGDWMVLDAIGFSELLWAVRQVLLDAPG